MAANMDKSVKSEIEASFGSFIKVILEILLPVALFFIGLAVLSSAVGLSGFYKSLLVNAPLPPTAIVAASSGVAILTWFGIGGGFIAVERAYDGWFGDIVGAIGWMSIGAGLREVLNFVTAQDVIPANALLSNAASKLSTSMQTAASGG